MKYLSHLFTFPSCCQKKLMTILHAEGKIHAWRPISIIFFKLSMNCVGNLTQRENLADRMQD